MNSAEQQVAEVWKQIEEWLAEHAPASLAALGGPATAEEIAVVEGDLGCSLPAEFAASLAIHRTVDLQGSAIQIEHSDLTRFAGLRQTEIEDFAWAAAAEHDQIRLDDFWRAGWIPLGREGDGSLYVLDLDPAPGGTYGQVLYADQGIVPETVYYPGWLAALQDFATELEAGKYQGVDGVLDWLE
ncbi:cell wall assembly regulator SMI1 [Kitasatospora sp. MAA19]|uniref:SMI1/KNR4 family protein n=1 Tax=unclassified Kitasatospora TaxID=2633591 RepID=UPI002473AB20|nr:SMI1/KNR4 family protein [Kitasatospora sp. MAA19]MDH6708396.1 cell wall assembly regulator SMI1 [Kitasatospora sp. MAA19]